MLNGSGGLLPDCENFANGSFAALILITADNTATSGSTLQQLHLLVAPATQPRYQGARSWPGWCWASSGVGWYLQQRQQGQHAGNMVIMVNMVSMPSSYSSTPPGCTRCRRPGCRSSRWRWQYWDSSRLGPALVTRRGDTSADTRQP